MTPLCHYWHSGVTILGGISFFFLIRRILTNAAGHLQLDQAVQLNRILYGEFLGDRLNEAVNDQRVGLGLIQAFEY